MTWSVSIASAADGAELSAFFARSSFGCHCRYWHHEGDSRQWLERCATRPQENAEGLRRQLATSPGELVGLIARDRDRSVVGWLKCGPVSSLSKIYEQRLYRGLPCFDRPAEGAFAVGCMLVDEAHRRQGVARALLRAAIERAPEFGATQLEAFPRAEQGVADAALMMGPMQLYLEAGFEVVHDFSPYPVVFKRLASSRGE